VALKRDFENIIENNNNKEMAIKHALYYLYEKNYKNRRLELLFNDYSKYKINEFNNIKRHLDDFNNKYYEEIINGNPGKIYEQITTNKLKKCLGQVYTPKTTINKMIKLSELTSKSINNNFKIIDISCGSGYFLIEIINELIKNGIHVKELLKNNIYAVDKDDFSVFLTKLSLLIKYKGLNYEDLKIYNDDFLFLKNSELKKIKFDLVIGNPPYVGHKNLDKQYRQKLYKSFKTFNNKADLSFCFFEKSSKIVKNNGIITLITSRYFLEANNAFEIRKFIKKNFEIEEIIDYYGYKLFKNANISPLIIKLKKRNTKGNFRYLYKNDIKFNEVLFDQKNLNDKKWIIKPQEELNLLRKIYNESANSIDDFIDFKQGIITGLDKAFVLKDKEAKKNKIEEQLLKKWIKNSDINNLDIKESNKKLIYLRNLDIRDYPNTFKYISKYREKLEKRRECRKGLINWYEIQWPREKNIFEKDKILFPYKANSPKFILDKNKNYCSADIYIGIKKDSSLKYELLEKYLNSKVFNFVCRMELKKVGENLYEFYPYSIKRLPILNKKKLIDFDSSGYINYEDYLFKILNLTKEEIKIVNRYYWRSS